MTGERQKKNLDEDFLSVEKKCLDEIKFKFQTIHIRCNISTDRTQRDFHFSPIGGRKDWIKTKASHVLI